MLKKISYLFLVLFIFSSSILFGQDKKLKEKIEEIKGEAEEIIIKTDEGEFTFSDKQAQTLLKKIKKSMKKFVFFSDDENEFEVDVDFDSDFEWSVGDQNFEILLEDDEDGTEKEIKINLNDGEKRVEITTKKDGEETTEVLEGEEAEEYLEKHRSNNINVFLKKDFKSGNFNWFDKLSVPQRVKVKMIDGDSIKVITKRITDKIRNIQIDSDSILFEVKKDLDNEDHLIFLQKCCDDDSMEKEVEVIEEDGSKKVIIKETVDGETKETVLEGKEAEEYLENNKMKRTKKMKIKVRKK